MRSRAITRGKIADILQARGDLDEALRIRTEEQLPVYERLGDVHSLAITQSEIADIFVERGELDEALRIYERDVLPTLRTIGNPQDIENARHRMESLRASREGSARLLEGPRA